MPNMRQFLRTTAIFICGAAVGAFAWSQTHPDLRPAAGAMVASYIDYEISESVMTLQMLDLNRIDDAKSFLGSQLKSTLDKTVPAALQWQMDERFRDQLRQSSQRAHTYLASQPAIPAATTQSSN
jgi:hypothetical protein